MPVMPAYLFQPQQLISSHLDAPSSAAASLHARYTHIRLCVCVCARRAEMACRARRALGRAAFVAEVAFVYSYQEHNNLCWSNRSYTAVRSYGDGIQWTAAAAAAHTQKNNTHGICVTERRMLLTSVCSPCVPACVRAARASACVTWKMEDGSTHWRTASTDCDLHYGWHTVLFKRSDRVERGCGVLWYLNEHLCFLKTVGRMG